MAFLRRIFKGSSQKEDKSSFSTEKSSKEAKCLLVAAIDFGTTFSSWAFSFRHEYESNPTNIVIKNWNSRHNISFKAPTTVLIRPDGKTFEAFGYDAENKFAELASEKEHREWYFFRKFKMSLFDNERLQRNILIKDEEGKELSAMTVFSLAIEYLKKDLLSECSKGFKGELLEKNIRWVITVPAIWNDGAKEFMREAAKAAGIPRQQLTIALEPEAASIYCKHIRLQTSSSAGKEEMVQLSPGTRYIIIDAGGGTVDTTLHEVIDDHKVKEIFKATGGAWGGQKVDESFRQFLIQLFGNKVIEEFKKVAMDDYFDFFREFEATKRNFQADREIKQHLKLPARLVETFKQISEENLKESITGTRFASNLELLPGNKLRMDHEVFNNFFSESVNKLVDHIQAFYDANEQFGISVALLVGGFSESPLLFNAVKDTWPAWKVVVPYDAGLAVLKGAVLFGHDPLCVTYRVCRYTYGISHAVDFEDGVHPMQNLMVTPNGRWICNGVFKPLIKEGDFYKCGDVIYRCTLYPVDDDLDHVFLPIYASKDKNVKYTTDNSCVMLGELRVDGLDMSVSRLERETDIKILLGVSEMIVQATDKKSERKLKASVNILQ